MKKLAISWIKNANSQEIVNLNQFLSFSAPRFLQSLYLYGDSVNLEVLLPSLPALLKKVRKQVYIFTMEINEAAFVWLFENLENVSELIIRDWKFSITGEFPELKQVISITSFYRQNIRLLTWIYKMIFNRLKSFSTVITVYMKPWEGRRIHEFSSTRFLCKCTIENANCINSQACSLSKGLFQAKLSQRNV